MGLTWGIVLVVFGGLAWLGQAISLIAPRRAATWGLTEAEDSVDPAFWADIRGEAAWDTLTLWLLPVAGVLLIADSSTWAYYGLAGGAVYAYFGGRGVLTRSEMLRRGVRIGEIAQVRVGMTALAAWMCIGIATVWAAAIALT